MLNPLYSKITTIPQMYKFWVYIANLIISIMFTFYNRCKKKICPLHLSWPQQCLNQPKFIRSFMGNFVVT